MRTPVLAALFSLACAGSAAALPQEVVREFGDPTPFDRSSWVDSAVGVGDVNGDGHADLIAADRREQGVDAPGVVRLVSGLDGAILARFEADPSLFQLGSTMALLEDVDGDGRQDVAVGAPLSGASRDVGAMVVLSGTSLQERFRIIAAVAGGRFGSNLRSAGDVDGDGRDDVLVSAPDLGRNQGPGRVFLLESSRSFASRVLLVGETDQVRLGATLQSLGDLDGDGVEDIAVTPGGTGNHKRARVHSGADDSLLFWEQFQTLAPWVDAEGDGLRDFADHQLGGDNGFLRVWRNTPIYLWAEDRALKVGQPLEFRLRSGPAQGKVLLLALKGRNLPVDLVLATGVLDAQGRWDAPSLTIPPGTEGLSFDFQAHVLPAGGGPLLSSAVKDVRVNR